MMTAMDNDTITIPTECPACGATGDSLTWEAGTRLSSHAPAAGHNRYNGHDFVPVMYLACEECSETLITLDGDVFLDALDLRHASRKAEPEPEPAPRPMTLQERIIDALRTRLWKEGKVLVSQAEYSNTGRVGIEVNGDVVRWVTYDFQSDNFRFETINPGSCRVHAWSVRHDNLTTLTTVQLLDAVERYLVEGVVA